MKKLLLAAALVAFSPLLSAWPAHLFLDPGIADPYGNTVNAFVPCGMSLDNYEQDSKTWSGGLCGYKDIEAFQSGRRFSLHCEILRVDLTDVEERAAYELLLAWEQAGAIDYASPSDAVLLSIAQRLQESRVVNGVETNYLRCGQQIVYFQGSEIRP